ncbi:MAG: hypothetical protein V4550_11405 [Gemmatimonadota bacterium]
MRSPSHFTERRSRGRIHVFVGLAGVAAIAACTIPTDAPVTDVRWVVPSQTQRIAVANLLPSGVSILADSSGFTVTAATPAPTVRALSQDCASCVAANGLTAPKPAFIASASMTTTLPSDISSATLTGGTLNVVITNNYTFDPIRPNPIAGTPTGFAVITISNGSTVLGKDSVNGATTAIPANGGSLNRNIALAGTITGTAPVTVSVTLNSPAGEPVLIDASRTIIASATPQNLRVASANIAVTSKSVSSTSTIDLSSVDSTIIRKVQSGTLLMTVANPFAVTGTLTVNLTPAGGSVITKSVALATGNSTPSITFTQTEIQRLLGHSVSISYTGTVTGTGSVNVSPKQAVVVQTRLDLNLQLGTLKS